MVIQIFFNSEIAKRLKIHSHGCLIDFPDWFSAKNPINHTKTKANEVNPKKTST